MNHDDTSAPVNGVRNRLYIFLRHFRFANTMGEYPMSHAVPFIHRLPYDSETNSMHAICRHVPACKRMTSLSSYLCFFLLLL